MRILGANRPLSVLKETDHLFPPDKRRRSEEILVNTHMPYQMTVFSHVEHGFAVRADLTNRRVLYAKQQSFSHAVAWFNEFL